MQYYQTGRHSVEINFVYLTAGVSRVFVNFDDVTWHEVTIVKCHITKLWVGCPCSEGSRQNPTQGDTRLLPTRNWRILSKLSHLTTDNVKQIGLKLSHRRLSSPQNKYHRPVCTLQYWQVLTVIKTTLWNKGIITVKLSYNDPLFFHRLPVISLHVGHLWWENNTCTQRPKEKPDQGFTDHGRLADQSHSLIIKHGDNCLRKTKPINAWFPYLSQVFYNIKQSFCAILHPDRAG